MDGWCVGRLPRRPAHRLASITALLLLIPMFAAIGCETADEAGRQVVEIARFGFEPDTLHVSVGDTVVWVNRDVVAHTATERGGEWDSQVLPQNGSWTYVAVTPGEASYLCTLHPSMTGVIVVR